MIIATACEANKITEHFGHCEHFVLFEINDGKIISKKSIANPGHRPGFLPNFLKDLGVNVIISGGMGGGAVMLFDELNIEIVTGASGDSTEIVERYLSGALKSSGAICHEHQHKDECH